MSGTNLGPHHDLGKRLSGIEEKLRIAINRDVLANGAHVTGDTVTSGLFYSGAGRTAVAVSPIAAYWSPSGALGVASSSSVEIKTDIEPADPSDLVAAVYSLALVRFRYRQHVDELGDDAPHLLGSISEYVDKTPLREFLGREEDGAPSSITWERFSIPLLAAVQDLDRRLKSLGA